MFRFFAAVVVFVSVAALFLFADERCGKCLPKDVEDEIRRLQEEAEQADKEGDRRRAAELKEEVERIRKETEQRIERIRRIVEKSIESDEHPLPETTDTRRMLVERLMGYLPSVNLINALRLSQKQMKCLLECLQKKREVERSDEWEEVLRCLLFVKKSLEKGESVGREVFEVFCYAESLIVRIEEEEQKRRKAVAELVEEIENRLTDSQKEVIRMFIPCHLPPDDMNNPVRAGQAETPSGDMALLVDARRVPKNEFEEWFKNAVLPMIERNVEFSHKHPEFKGRLDRRREVRRVRRIFDKACRMSDVDFELNKKELARKLDLIDPFAGKLDKNLKGKIEKFLLNEDLIPLLKKRLAEMEKENAPEK